MRISSCVPPSAAELDVVDVSVIVGVSGQFGSRRRFTSLNSVASASKRSSRR
jgi:hypothetical protein